MCSSDLSNLALSLGSSPSPFYTASLLVFSLHNHDRRKSNLALSLGSSPSPFYTASLLLVFFIRPWQTHLCKFRASNTSLTKRSALHNVISRCLLSRATTIWNSTLNCFCPLLSPPSIILTPKNVVGNLGKIISNQYNLYTPLDSPRFRDSGTLFFFFLEQY